MLSVNAIHAVDTWIFLCNLLEEAPPTPRACELRVRLELTSWKIRRPLPLRERSRVQEGGVGHGIFDQTRAPNTCCCAREMASHGMTATALTRATVRRCRCDVGHHTYVRVLIESAQDVCAISS
eukprot:796205-Rhodomonas_salina.4